MFIIPKLDERSKWTVVIPVKVLARAKSRLAPLAGSRRGELALAMAADTVSAVAACHEVARVLVVTSDERVRERLASPRVCVVRDEPAREPAGGLADGLAGGVAGGLNAALLHGASVAARRWPGTPVAALSADLPALRAAELSRALRAASALPSAFVADAQGLGTTLYAAASAAEFRPMFGGASRLRHAAGGACELLLDGIPGLRRDVDTPEDLRAAVTLGAGRATMALAGELLSPSLPVAAQLVR